MNKERIKAFHLLKRLQEGKMRREREVREMKMTIKEACKLLDISRSTLLRWDKVGIIHFDKTALGNRIFKEEMIPQLQQIIKKQAKEASKRRSWKRREVNPNPSL